MQSEFHGYANEKFLITRRLYDKSKHRVLLDLMRDIGSTPSCAVDSAGGAYDSYAIDTDNEGDVNWASRAYGN
jgi:hypothetical protein